MPAIGISIIIGALTGGFAGYLQNKLTIMDLGFLGAIISWIVEPNIREAFTLNLGNDLDKSNIPNPKNGIKYSAWATSWIIYLGILD